MNKQVLTLANMFYFFGNGGIFPMEEIFNKWNICKATAYADLSILRCVLSELGMANYDIKVINHYYMLLKQDRRVYFESRETG